MTTGPTGYGARVPSPRERRRSGNGHRHRSRRRTAGFLELYSPHGTCEDVPSLGSVVDAWVLPRLGSGWVASARGPGSERTMNTVPMSAMGIRVSEICLGTDNYGSRIPPSRAFELLPSHLPPPHCWYRLRWPGRRRSRAAGLLPHLRLHALGLLHTPQWRLHPARPQHRTRVPGLGQHHPAASLE